MKATIFFAVIGIIAAFVGYNQYYFDKFISDLLLYSGIILLIVVFLYSLMRVRK